MKYLLSMVLENLLPRSGEYSSSFPFFHFPSIKFTRWWEPGDSLINCLLQNIMLAIKFFCNNGRVVKKSVSFNYWELVISFGQIKPYYMLLTSRKTLPWPSLIMGYIPFTSQINLRNTLHELWLQALRIQLVETLNKPHKTEWCFIASMTFLWSLKHIDIYTIYDYID